MIDMFDDPKWEEGFQKIWDDYDKYIKEEERKEQEEKKRLEDVFNRGVEAGRKQMMDHIQHQCSIGKPVECNGELYFFKTAQQNLMDIMNDIDNAWNEEHGEKKLFIVPIRRFCNTSTDVKELLIKANDANVARLIALGFENDHIGWTVDEDCENYKQVKIIWEDTCVKN